jgi:hypothetical protein
MSCYRWEFWISSECIAFHAVAHNEGFDPPWLHHPKDSAQSSVGFRGFDPLTDAYFAATGC